MSEPSKKRIKHRPADRTLERRIKFFIRTWQGRIMYPRFQRWKERANGMMLAQVYKHIYQEVRKLPDGDIVEVGGAAGASAITAAKARIDSGRTGNVITVEKCSGGSRNRYGDYKSNLEIFHEHLEDLGVSDRVILYPHYLTDENVNEVHALIQSENIVALFHDADSRVDRDFTAFLPKLNDGGLIVVDDYLPHVTIDHPKVKLIPQKMFKFVVTAILLEKMVGWGVYEHVQIVGGTAFGRKPAGADVSRIDRQECQNIVDGVSKKLGVPVPGAVAAPEEQSV